MLLVCSSFTSWWRRNLGLSVVIDISTHMYITIHASVFLGKFGHLC